MNKKRAFKIKLFSLVFIFAFLVPTVTSAYVMGQQLQLTMNPPDDDTIELDALQTIDIGVLGVKIVVPSPVDYKKPIPVTLFFVRNDLNIRVDPVSFECHLSPSDQAFPVEVLSHVWDGLSDFTRIDVGIYNATFTPLGIDYTFRVDVIASWIDITYLPEPKEFTLDTRSLSPETLGALNAPVETETDNWFNLTGVVYNITQQVETDIHDTIDYLLDLVDEAEAFLDDVDDFVGQLNNLLTQYQQFAVMDPANMTVLYINITDIPSTLDTVELYQGLESNKAYFESLGWEFTIYNVTNFTYLRSFFNHTDTTNNSKSLMAWIVNAHGGYFPTPYDYLGELSKTNTCGNGTARWAEEVAIASLMNAWYWVMLEGNPWMDYVYNTTLTFSDKSLYDRFINLTRFGGGFIDPVIEYRNNTKFVDRIDAGNIIGAHCGISLPTFNVTSSHYFVPPSWTSYGQGVIAVWEAMESITDENGTYELTLPHHFLLYDTSGMVSAFYEMDGDYDIGLKFFFTANLMFVEGAVINSIQSLNDIHDHYENSSECRDGSNMTIHDESGNLSVEIETQWFGKNLTALTALFINASKVADHVRTNHTLDIMFFLSNLYDQLSVLAPKFWEWKEAGNDFGVPMCISDLLTEVTNAISSLWEWVGTLFSTDGVVTMFDRVTLALQLLERTIEKDTTVLEIDMDDVGTNYVDVLFNFSKPVTINIDPGKEERLFVTASNKGSPTAIVQVYLYHISGGTYPPPSGGLTYVGQLTPQAYQTDPFLGVDSFSVHEFLLTPAHDGAVVQGVMLRCWDDVAIDAVGILNNTDYNTLGSIIVPDFTSWRTLGNYWDRNFLIVDDHTENIFGAFQWTYNHTSDPTITISVDAERVTQNIRTLLDELLLELLDGFYWDIQEAILDLSHQIAFFLAIPPFFNPAHVAIGHFNNLLWLGTLGTWHPTTYRYSIDPLIWYEEFDPDLPPEIGVLHGLRWIICKLLHSVGTDLINYLSPFLGGVMAFIQGFMKKVQSGFTQVVGHVLNIISPILRGVFATFETISDMLHALSDATRDIIEITGDMIIDTFEMATGLLLTITQFVDNIANEIIDDIFGFIDDLWTATATVESIVGIVPAIATTIGDHLTDGTNFLTIFANALTVGKSKPLFEFQVNAYEPLLAIDNAHKGRYVNFLTVGHDFYLVVDNVSSGREPLQEYWVNLTSYNGGSFNLSLADNFTEVTTGIYVFENGTNYLPSDVYIAVMNGSTMDDVVIQEMNRVNLHPQSVEEDDAMINIIVDLPYAIALTQQYLASVTLQNLVYANTSVDIVFMIRDQLSGVPFVYQTGTAEITPFGVTVVGFDVTVLVALVGYYDLYIEVTEDGTGDTTTYTRQVEVVLPDMAWIIIEAIASFLGLGGLLFASSYRKKRKNKKNELSDLSDLFDCTDTALSMKDRKMCDLQKKMCLKDKDFCDM